MKKQQRLLVQLSFSHANNVRGHESWRTDHQLWCIMDYKLYMQWWFLQEPRSIWHFPLKKLTDSSVTHTDKTNQPNPYHTNTMRCSTVQDLQEMQDDQFTLDHRFSKINTINEQKHRKQWDRVTCQQININCAYLCSDSSCINACSASTAKEKERNSRNSCLHKEPHGGGQNVSTKDRSPEDVQTNRKAIRILQRVT